MKRELDYSKAVACPGADAVLECRRLEHLLAGYQAFLGHDLANQLVSIQAFARLLHEQYTSVEEDGADETRLLLDRLAAAARRADQQARRLAEIGRLLREPPYGPALSFVELAREGIAEVKSAPRVSPAQASGISYDVIETTTTVRTSRRLLDRVLVELLHNASAAALPGRPLRVEIAAREESPAERSDGSPPVLVVTVTDTGRGITEAEADRLGSSVAGLGLFLVVAAVARWRGRMTVESNRSSTAGEGTSITLFVPEGTGPPRSPGRRDGLLTFPDPEPGEP